MKDAMLRVIFVCTGNICRSPMGVGIMKDRLQKEGIDSFEVTSMGTHGLDNKPASSNGAKICAEHGIDISDHRSRELIIHEMDRADIIFCMEKVHKEYIRVFFPRFEDKTQLLGAWPDRKENRKAGIPDPYGKSERAYRKTFKVISDHIDYVLPHVIENFFNSGESN